MNSERKTVLVSSSSVKGYADPCFVLKSNGKIYVTLGVLEYDPANKDMHEDERADLADLQAILEGPCLVSGTTLRRERRIAAMAQAQSRDN